MEEISSQSTALEGCNVGRTSEYAGSDHMKISFSAIKCCQWLLPGGQGIAHDLQSHKLTRSCYRQHFYRGQDKGEAIDCNGSRGSMQIYLQKSGLLWWTDLSGIPCSWPQTVYGPEVLGRGRSFLTVPWGSQSSTPFSEVLLKFVVCTA